MPDGVDIRPHRRVLTDLYVQKPVHSPEEETQFVELALGLVDAVDTQARATVAAAPAYPGSRGRCWQLNASISRAAAGGKNGQDDLIDLFFLASPEERRLILVNLEFVSRNTARRFPCCRRILASTAALKSDPDEFSRVLERALGISRTGRQDHARLFRGDNRRCGEGDRTKDGGASAHSVMSEPYHRTIDPPSLRAIPFV